SPARRTEIEVWIDAGQCFVAERDREIVGYGILTRNFFHSFFIDLLMVSEPERRSGVGTALIGLHRRRPARRETVDVNQRVQRRDAQSPGPAWLHSERADRQSRRGRSGTGVRSPPGV